MDNNKGSLGQALVAALLASIAAVAVNRVLPDRAADERQTVTAIATLAANVASLSKQVDKLTEQPYATRADLDGISTRVTGLEQRFTEHIREEQPRRAR